MRILLYKTQNSSTTDLNFARRNDMELDPVNEAAMQLREKTTDDLLFPKVMAQQLTTVSVS